MTNDKRIKQVAGGAVFLVALLNYWITMAPTVSFWDCGELSACAHILGNPHPPGNPSYFMLGRFFIITMRFLSNSILRTNWLSVLSFALVSLFAFLFTEKLIALVFKGKATAFTRYSSAIIAAFLVTFSDTVWFSAVETESYGTSFFLIMLNSWLGLYWYENMGKAKGERALLLICYLAFLGMGVNHFTIISVPAIAVFVLLADPSKRRDWLFILTGFLLLSVIYMIGVFVFIALAVLALTVVVFLLSRSPEWKGRARFSMWMCLCALLGFSCYLYVPLRSWTNPDINENQPSNYSAFQEYLERKQYGSESMLGRAFHRRAAVQNQILVYPHIGYGGYMFAQYLPWKMGETRADENESRYRNVLGKKLEFPTLYTTLGKWPRLAFLLFLLFQAPFLYALYRCWGRNRALVGYAALLYGLTSYGMIFYMNFADGSQMEMRDYEYWKSTGFDPNQKPENVHIEVRDRDYFFTPAFIYMGILFGFAAAYLQLRLRERRPGRRGEGAARGAGVALAALSFAVPCWSNFHENNRHSNYVPWDYAYNLLMSCQPNAILFTNGDNDTFPLWFMQEVEGVRKDVRVVNLSLVNTDWYIAQMKTIEPKLAVGFTEDEIRNIQPQPWPNKKGAISWDVPGTPLKVDLEPRAYLKVQDIMVINLVRNNYPAHPVHFAVTVSDDNMMGLEKYLIMQGMVYTLTEAPRNKDVDVASTVRLVDTVYKYRGLGDQSTYLDLNTEGLLSNYSATDFRLVETAQKRIAELDGKIDAARKAGGAGLDSLQRARAAQIAFGEKYLDLNSRLLPHEWRNYYYAAMFYSSVKDYAKAEENLRKGQAESPQPRVFAVNLAQLYLEEQKYAPAESLLGALKDQSPGDFELWYGLSETYRKDNKPKQAYNVLSEWLKRNPSHQYAPMVAQQLQAMDAEMKAAPKADSAKRPDSAKAGAGGNGKDTAARGAAPAKGHG